MILVRDRVPPLGVVLPGYFEGDFDGLGASGYKIHPGHPLRGKLNDFIRQFDLSLAGEMPGVRKADFSGLPLHRLNDLGHSVADVHHEGPTGGIDIFLPLGVVEVYPLPPFDHRVRFPPIAIKNSVLWIHGIFSV